MGRQGSLSGASVFFVLVFFWAAFWEVALREICIFDTKVRL